MRIRITGKMSLPKLLSLSLVVLLALLVLLIRFYPYSYNFPAFPKITRTASGAAGDPINIAFVGSQQQITQSFQQAGWLVPDPITLQTSERIAADSLAHRSYPTAPVSNLYVFGRAQDLAFEKPTSDVANRDHIRLWQTDTRIADQPVWLGQASYDHGVELSGINHLPTHHIAPAVDLERDAVGADLTQTGLGVEQSYGAFTPPILAAYNGGGDYYASDGDLLVINYAHAPLSLTPSAGVVPDLKKGAFRVYDTLLTNLLLALVAGIVGLALLLVGLWPALLWLFQRVATRPRPKR